ncbi:MAG TPA: dTDP-glucose 4,6-dehydratase [Lentisphaeria bacterium]|nr:MAG: dTDP-glucose 4,6-dehydratase [Lentisphaerae bacterium GWF2_49_21]HBC87933.1 dTDP-glucose 4,6-dehydratase [Lentisphaeria bacterium]
MKILVTGGAGFIGSHIVEHFQGKADIVILDNFRTGKKQNLKGFDYKLIEGSILEKKAVREAVKGADYIFHMAAAISVVESMEKPVEYVKVNTEGTLIVLEESAAAGVKKLCFSTSAACYGENPESPKVETMKPEPLSPYAITKLDGEYYCEMFAREGKLKTTSMRYFNVFGPRQDPKSVYAAAIPIFVSRAVANAPISIYGDGEQTRDFVYVKDVVAANVFMSQNDISGVFNVAYGNKITIDDLVKMVIRMTGSKSKIEYKPERPGEVKHSLASTEKLLSTGFSPSSDFKEGMKATVAYFSGLK